MSHGCHLLWCRWLPRCLLRLVHPAAKTVSLRNLTPFHHPHMTRGSALMERLLRRGSSHCCIRLHLILWVHFIYLLRIAAFVRAIARRSNAFGHRFFELLDTGLERLDLPALCRQNRSAWHGN